ncbi:hypothetical protein ETH_00006625 [Eimeria tenella]|uniref:Uncharacterized protein n=1 Tax=Eimeria tenella TaxID=5802 RepID=U6KXI5_EIMTE|nr:hypothetical protein ETH_00006625 [Eimeria tenella]CDJ42676.1 hypothetical protein ETH_00006625 [Eimeria tenella]|eukprot:XP_013233426.1 hypothetical protein ETH_00006625 [Eimeria tenella]
MATSSSRRLNSADIRYNTSRLTIKALKQVVHKNPSSLQSSFTSWPLSCRTPSTGCLSIRPYILSKRSNTHAF